MPRAPIPRSVARDIERRTVYEQQIAESVKRQREEARAEREDAAAEESETSTAAEESADTTTAARAARKGRHA